ncbi:ATP-binding protein [Streptomyces sp. NBC_01477]|uniref:ATP-binding protein n=1 Tax=Streptomyces sp. NBC_01477 TaxID=2976015 RepID=UPI003FCD1515
MRQQIWVGLFPVESQRASIPWRGMKEVTGVSLMVAQEVPTSSTMALPHGPTGVAEARRRMRGDLYAQDVPETVIDDAVLILSELLSNSCRHARPLGDQADAMYGVVEDTAGTGVGARSAAQDRGIRAGWAIGTDGLLKVEVTDGGGPTRPRPSSPSLTAHGGRGLGIVGSLALRWGVRDGAPGEVTVWALLPVRGRHARRDDLGSGGTGIGLPRGIPLGLPLDLAESLDDLS